jgi:hypothetical protein
VVSNSECCAKAPPSATSDIRIASRSARGIVHLGWATG